MKRIMMVVLFALTIFTITPVMAMSEADLTAKVKATYDINGHSLTVPTKYVNLYEDYVNQFEISGEDCQYVADQIDILVAAARKKGVVSIADFQKKCAEEIRRACENVSANTGIKATVLSDGRVSVSKYNNPNEVFAIIGTHIAVNTANMGLIAIVSAISLIGAGLLAFKIKKA